jgi:glycosyltransferase involved in cell wall biosynthesis
MIVYHLESSLNFGGQETRTLRESKAFVERGHQVTIVAPPGSKILDRARSIGLRVRSLEMPNSLWPRAILTLRRWIREDRVQILHAHSSKDAWIAAIAARLSRRRPGVIRTRHITNPIKHRFAYAYLPDRLMVISQPMRDRFIRDHRVAPEKVVLFKPAVDWRRFDQVGSKERCRSELGCRKDDFLVGMVAEFRGEKDHATLVRGFDEVFDEIPHARLVLVGDEGKRGAKVRQLVKDLGLENAVDFLGQRDDVPVILRALDVSVLSSAREPFGAVILEAMGAETPVIATRVEGPVEMIDHGRTGLLFEPGNAHQLAEALFLLYRDRTLARQLASNAAAWVREQHDFAKAMDRLEKIYQELLDELRA